MSSNPAAVLKEIYAAAGRAADYFETTGPDLHLYRAQTNDDFKKNVFILEPGKADVRTEDRQGKLWVLGCSAVKGKYHNGVSTFDKQISPTKNHTRMYEIPKKVDLPEGLAITKDNLNKTFNATHYSLAPKNDMPMELFIQSLKVVADACKMLDEEAKAK
jgi:hypothetical protein